MAEGSLDFADAHKVFAGLTISAMLRIDPAVMVVLRVTGPGWQTRANTILRERFAL